MLYSVFISFWRLASFSSMDFNLLIALGRSTSENKRAPRDTSRRKQSTQNDVVLNNWRVAFEHLDIVEYLKIKRYNEWRKPPWVVRRVPVGLMIFLTRHQKRWRDNATSDDPPPPPPNFCWPLVPISLCQFVVNVWFSTVSLAGEKNQDSSVDRCLLSWGEKKTLNT